MRNGWLLWERYAPKKEYHLKYRDYKKENPLIIHYFNSFKIGDSPGAVDISYELTRSFENAEEVHLFGFGESFSLKIDPDKKLYIDVLGDKTIVQQIS